MDGMLYMLFTAGLGLGTGIKGSFLVLILPAGFITGYYSRYIAILIKKQILIMEREEEIVRFQTIILMVMHMDRITIQEILKRMENFAAIFKEEIYELSNQISCRGINIFRDAKGRNGFVPYEKLLDGFIACDTMPVYRAFEDVESDRNYYVEKHKQDNEQNISQKAMIAKNSFISSAVHGYYHKTDFAFCGAGNYRTQHGYDTLKMKKQIEEKETTAWKIH